VELVALAVLFSIDDKMFSLGQWFADGLVPVIYGDLLGIGGTEGGREFVRPCARLPTHKALIQRRMATSFSDAR
jgi:hypothetical protein